MNTITVPERHELNLEQQLQGALHGATTFGLPTMVSDGKRTGYLISEAMYHEYMQLKHPNYALPKLKLNRTSAGYDQTGAQ